MNQPGTNTKERMIAATAKLLELQGYHATGLNQVLKESSTPKGSLYFHFPEGKEELAAEAILVAGAEITQKIALTLSSAEQVGDAISAFALMLAQELQDSDFRKGCPVATVAMETSATNERLRQACEQVYFSWFTLIEQRLLTAEFNSAEAKTWTTFVWASVEGALLLSRTYRSTAPLKIVAEQLRDLLNSRNPLANNNV